MSRHSAWLALVVAALGLGCSANADMASAAGKVGGTAGSAGFGGSAGASGFDAGEPIPDQLAFSPSAPLTLAPTAVHPLTVVATPPGAYTVHFALIGAPGVGAGDGALDTSTAITDALGQATVTLTAPSMPMSFNVRASVDTVRKTLLGVTVNGTSVTNLSVVHSYGGHRKVSEWTATIWELVDCSELSGPPPADGDHLTTSPADSELILSGVPVATALAVTLRAGHYIGGCANVTGLSEGGSNQVIVFASDRPINLAQTQLSVSFGFAAPSAELQNLLTSSLESTLSALGGAQGDDVSALWDAIAGAVPSADRSAFDAARTAGGWDAALAAAYGSGAASHLRDGARPWFTSGLQRFEQGDAFSGSLSPVSASSAELELTSVAGLSPLDAGFALGSSSIWSVSWAADSNDNLLLATELGWVPSRLMSALAVAPALGAYPTASSIDDALAELADCASVANVAVQHGTSPGTLAYGSCDGPCIEAACRKGLDALWQSVRDASGSESADLTVTATGASLVGDEANVVSMQGNWVGKLGLGSASVSADGAFNGQ